MMLQHEIGNKVPIISSPIDLVGKIIDHYTDKDINDDMSSHRGLVLKHI